MQKKNFSIKGFVVWGISAIFFLYEFFLRTVIGTFQHPITESLNISSFEFSFLSTTIFLIFYGAMQFPTSIIATKIGLNKTLTAGCSICAITCLGFAFSNNFYTALTFRLFMGLGSSVGFICLLISVHEWMPKRHNALFIGLSQFIGTMGPMLSAGPLHSAIETTNLDWRSLFFSLSIVGSVIAVFIFLFVENNKEKAGKFIILNRQQKTMNSIVQLFSKSAPWCIALFSAGLYFAIEYLTENEGRPFLMLKGLSASFASYMITLSWVSFAFACPLLGFLSDFTQKRKPIMVMSAVCACSAIILIVFGKEKYQIFLGFFLLGIGASGQSIGFSIIAEHFKKDSIAIGFGLNNCMITLVSGINAPAISLLLDHSKGSSSSLTLEHYYFAFSPIVAMIFFALVLSIFFIKETYAKSRVEFTYIGVT
jgi:MFS family permease